MGGKQECGDVNAAANRRRGTSRKSGAGLCGLLVWLAVAPVTGVGFSQETGASPDAVLTTLGDRVSLFFESLGRDQASEAFSDLLVASTLAEQEDDLKLLVAQTVELGAKYGRYRGAEQIGARRVGQDVVLLRYLAKYDQCPVVWTFVFYRPPPLPAATPAEPEAWRIVSVQFHTEWERL